MSINFNICYKFWIENKEGKSILGDGKFELLKAIQETGSLKAATDKMNWGYRSTWNKIKELEKNLGFNLIEKKRGGSAGGQTILTEQGRLLVNYFNEFHDEANKLLHKPTEAFLQKINSLNKA